MARVVEPDQAKLYELIWKRTIASQMESAELERTTVDITAKVGGRMIDLRATGQVVKFDGFLTLYQEDQDDPTDDEDDDETAPAADQPGRDARQARDRRRASISPSRRRATRKPRWSSAWKSSASAGPRPTPRSCRCCKDRGYVRIDKKRLVPEDKGRVLTAFLESFFARYVEYDFTAGLEEQLDQISNNELAWQSCCATSGTTSSPRSATSRSCASRR